MFDKKSNLVERLALLWGGSVGFVVGAALAAWLGKLAGWWPLSENRLKRTKRS